MKTTTALAPDTDGCLSLINDSAFRDHAIVSRTLLQTPELRVVLFHFDAGQELTEHTSPHRALVQILSGSCAFKLGAAWLELKTGDLVHMPPHLPHAVRAGERFSMLLTLAHIRTAPKTEADSVAASGITVGNPLSPGDA